MNRIRAHPTAATALAFAVAGVTVLAIAAAYGFAEFGHAFSHPSFGWLALSAGGAVLAMLAYAIAYRTLIRFEEGPRLAPSLLLQMVIVGFGPFVPAGGFAMDKRALQQLHHEPSDPTVRVLGLGAVEWAVLAPAAWASAVILLAVGDTRPMASQWRRRASFAGRRLNRCSLVWVGMTLYWVLDIASLYGALASSA